MEKRIRHLLLVALLTLSVVAVTPITGSAGPIEGPDCIYFPWVPNGVEIEDPDSDAVAGPFHGALTIQNLENAQVSVFLMPFDHCNVANPGIYYLMSIAPNAAISFNISATGLIPEGEGGGIVVVGRLAENLNHPARIAGIQRQASPTSLSSAQFSIGTHETVSGYTALTHMGVDGQVHLPIVQTNNNWNTIIRATNFDREDNANIHILLYEAGGGGTIGPFFQLTGPGETATFDLRDLGVPEEWVGSATVTGGLPIGAIAERVKVETNMLLINTSRTAEQFAEKTYSALIFRDWHHWNTGISIANPTGFPNNITIRFYDMEGNEVHDEDLVIPATGMDFVYLPAGDGSPFVGSAVIEGDQVFHGAVDEVKYLGSDGDTGHAMSYTMDYRFVTEGYGMALPMAWNPSPSAPAIGETTGIQVFNAGSDPAQVRVTFRHALDGTFALPAPIEFELDPLHSETVYALDIEGLPTNFRGTATVINVESGPIGASGLVAISNLVNYDVQYDGSSTFGLTYFYP
jgi:hypothetical protein